MEEKLYRTLDAAKMAGITGNDPRNVRFTFSNAVKKLSLVPAAEKPREGKGGSPEKFWTAEQIAAIAENYKAHCRKASRTEDNVTLPAPPVTIESTPAVVTLDERADRIRKLTADVQRGIIEIGFELIAAKKEIEHGGWGDWLKSEFDWTDRTARNFMAVAERFGNRKTFSDLKPSTLQAMLKLPNGDEEEFIETQAAAGKPVKSQSAREIQKSVKEWNKAKELDGEHLNVTGAVKNNAVVSELNNDTPAETVSNFDSHPQPEQDTQTTEPATDDDQTILLEYEIIKSEQITVIRELINQTDDLQTINAIRNSLLELTREIGELVSLTEAKIEELSKRE